MTNKMLIKTSVIVLIVIGIYFWIIVPRLLAIPKNFNYEVEIFSLDNFYNQELGDFSGEDISITRFSYDVVEKQNSVLLVKNVFDVRTINNDKIFAVERLYGIDNRTGQHVSGFGDKDRQGYLFAPRMKGFFKQVQDKEPFIYWHINYDGPADMQFVAEEDILGLKVYKYESRYEGIDIDQTAELGHLPGVPEEKGVNLDPHLELWIEPKTGQLIKYKDQTTAYYYDINSKERLYPWNRFSNRLSKSSIAEQVRLTKKIIKQQTLVGVYTPAIMTLFALLLLSIALIRGRIDS